MPEEVEVKVLNIDVPKVLFTLGRLGARKVWEGRMPTNFYDFPDRRLEQDHKSCRVRYECDEVILCYKHKKKNNGKVKICDEFEENAGDIDAVYKLVERVELFHFTKKDKENMRSRLEQTADAFERARTILASGGLDCFFELEKDRIAYVFGQINYAIDKLPPAQVPHYLEVESRSKELVRRGLGWLRLSMEQSTSKTWREVLKDVYGIDVDKMRELKF